MGNNARKNALIFIGLLLAGGNAHAGNISGAGATFPSTVYKTWARAYQEQSGIGLNYQDTGSGDGIKQIEASTVDFGASDKPLKPDDLEKNGLLQFPTVVGGAVPVINIAGVDSGALKLSGPVLAAIFLGKIAKWNDPAIAALNPGIRLPNENIAVIHRSDASGTTFIFTNYLSKVSPEWKSEMGEGTTVPWKVGAGCRTNLLIPVCLYQNNNSIGYMDYAYAKKTAMNMVQLQNEAGHYVAPNSTSFQAAAKYAKWEQATDFYEILTNEPGDASWPIVGATFILMHRVQDKPETGKEVLKFFDFAYTKGDELASELGYIPLPKQLQQQVRQVWMTQIKDAKGNPLCPNGC